VWRHANQAIQFSSDWEWSDDIDDDLNCGFSELNLNSKPNILKEFKAPKNWSVLSTSAAPYNPDDFEPESIDVEEISLLIPAKVDWDSYFNTLIVPFRFDPNKWMASDTKGKLVAMGQVDGDSSLRSDGVIATSFNSGYYVSACIELHIETDTDDGEEAIEMAKKELNLYLQSDFSSEIQRILPEMDGDPNFDESISIFLAPNWVFIKQ
jgi:hypothetical protein